jgi:hypothetical protein
VSSEKTVPVHLDWLETGYPNWPAPEPQSEPSENETSEEEK